MYVSVRVFEYEFTYSLICISLRCSVLYGHLLHVFVLYFMYLSGKPLQYTTIRMAPKSLLCFFLVFLLKNVKFLNFKFLNHIFRI